MTNRIYTAFMMLRRFMKSSNTLNEKSFKTQIYSAQMIQVESIIGSNNYIQHNILWLKNKISIAQAPIQRKSASKNRQTLTRLQKWNCNVSKREAQESFDECIYFDTQTNAKCVMPLHTFLLITMKMYVKRISIGKSDESCNAPKRSVSHFDRTSSIEKAAENWAAVDTNGNLFRLDWMKPLRR